jgi:hypothetical protein
VSCEVVSERRALCDGGVHYDFEGVEGRDDVVDIAVRVAGDDGGDVQ